MTRTATALEPVVDGLYATSPRPLPFAPSLHVRAFLLQRERGNILVYSTDVLGDETPAIDDLGGAARHYLGHGHEAMFLRGKRPAAPLFSHAGDREAVARAAPVRGTFSRRHALDDDFEAIPIPGHTSGSTAYLWDTGTQRLLFTADTIYLDHGEWVAAVLASSDRDAYVESLELIRELDFDVLVPWVASAGDAYHAATGREDARERIDALLARVRRGSDR